MLDIKNLTLRSESEIMSTWNDKENIKVSIVCATYNQEAYIEYAIKGFLMQETDFAFEIIINDDASPDKTAEIINHYQLLFPNIIKPIFQSENQLSQGRKALAFMIKEVKGDYIAMCEGDDYWINPLKLQKQVDVFTNDSSVSLCFHSAIELDMLREKEKEICNHYENDRVTPISDVILGRGPFMPTASLMFVNKSLDKLLESYQSAPVGDIFIQIFMSSIGTAYYINEPMSLYRFNSIGSWTVRSHTQRNDKIKHKQSMISAIDRFSPYVAEGKYNEYFKKVILFYSVDSLKASREYNGKINSLISLIEIYQHLEHYNKYTLLCSTFFRFGRYEVNKLTTRIVNKIRKFI